MSVPAVTKPVGTPGQLATEPDVPASRNEPGTAGTPVPPLGRRDIGTKAAPSSLRAGALGTAAVPRRTSSNAKTDKRRVGRMPDGPACIGCVGYEVRRSAGGALTGVGYCVERERAVTAVYRGACGLYQFWGAARRG